MNLRMMKLRLVASLSILLSSTMPVWADVAPINRDAKGLITLTAPTQVQMKTEKVSVDLYNDSSVVNCTFVMQNFGEPITMEVGFPEMNFLQEDGVKQLNTATLLGQQQWQDWKIRHKDVLKMQVNNQELSLENLQLVCAEQNPDSRPWFVWSEYFDRGMTTIKVHYSLPYGTFYHGNKHIGANNSRSFTYILETGVGWYEYIDEAEIEIRVHGIELHRIEAVSPMGSVFDLENRVFRWHFNNLEPTSQDNITIIYYDPEDRKWTDDYFKMPATQEETYGNGKWYRDYISAE